MSNFCFCFVFVSANSFPLKWISMNCLTSFRGSISMGRPLTNVSFFLVSVHADKVLYGVR